MFGQPDMKFAPAPAGRRGAGDVRCLPAEHSCTKPQGSRSVGSLSSASKCSADLRTIDLGLARRRQAEFLQQDRRDDEPDRLDVVQPFEVRIALDLGRHRDQPIAGQR